MDRLVMNIKFSKADIRNSDIKSVSDILKSGWLTHGQIIRILDLLLRYLVVQQVYIYHVWQWD